MMKFDGLIKRIKTIKQHNCT